MHIGRERRFDHILCTVYIRFDAFLGIIFSCINLFDGGCVNNHIHTFASTYQTFEITNITNKVTHLRIFFFRILLFQFELLQFITRINNDFLYLWIITENSFHKLLTERTCSSGNQYGFVIKHYNGDFYSSIYSHG